MHHILCKSLWETAFPKVQYQEVDFADHHNRSKAIPNKTVCLYCQGHWFERIGGVAYLPNYVIYGSSDCVDDDLQKSARLLSRWICNNCQRSFFVHHNNGKLTIMAGAFWRIVFGSFRYTFSQFQLTCWATLFQGATYSTTTSSTS